MKLVLTCEHGGNFVPKQYSELFLNEALVLQTHRGYDIGALDLFKYLKPLSDFSNFSETSRLLIELNRSLHHKHLFSEYSKNLPKEAKQHLIHSHYLIYRNTIESYIKKEIKKNQSIIHISIHSFTPILNNEERNCDIGLLFDSARPTEKTFSKSLKQGLLQENPNLKIRFNYPYLGKADGFTTYLRKQFPIGYLGIELEINQKFAVNNMISFPIKKALYNALQQTLIK